MRGLLGRFSRWLNRLTGGEPGQTLCARIGERYGTECWFCRIVARFTERDHCSLELRQWRMKQTRQ